jgi:hypothetical protein
MLGMNATSDFAYKGIRYVLLLKFLQNYSFLYLHRQNFRLPRVLISVGMSDHPT